MGTNLLGIHGVRVEVVGLIYLDQFVREYDGQIIDIVPYNAKSNDDFVIVVYQEKEAA